MFVSVKRSTVNEINKVEKGKVYDTFELSTFSGMGVMIPML